MADSSIALTATNLYTSIQDRQKIQVEPTTVKGANEFQNMVKVQFNKFSEMSPDQILNHIKAAQGTGRATAAASTGQASGIASTIVRGVRTTLNKQERTSRKALINEASLIDVLTTTTEATNTVKTLVEVRNKFLEAYDKVMNMSV